MVLAALLSIAHTASAAPAPTGTSAATPEAESAARYNAGKRAFDQGDLPRAVTELTASIAAKPSSHAYLLLGTTQAKVGDLEAAERAFTDLLAAEPRYARRATVEKMIADLKVIARTKVSIVSTPPGASVYLDLRAEGLRGKTPLTLPAPRGPHRVLLDLEGYAPSVSTVVAVEGQVVETTIALSPLAAVTPPPVVATAPPGPTSHTERTPKRSLIIAGIAISVAAYLLDIGVTLAFNHQPLVEAFIPIVGPLLQYEDGSSSSPTDPGVSGYSSSLNQLFGQGLAVIDLAAQLGGIALAILGATLWADEKTVTDAPRVMLVPSHGGSGLAFTF